MWPSPGFVGGLAPSVFSAAPATLPSFFGAPATYASPATYAYPSTYGPLAGSWPQTLMAPAYSLGSPVVYSGITGPFGLPQTADVKVPALVPQGQERRRLRAGQLLVDPPPQKKDERPSSMAHPK